MNLKKIEKRIRLASNKLKGDVGETIVRAYLVSTGKSIIRSPHGQDYTYHDTDLFGREKGRSRKVEVKTGNAKLTKLQKRIQKKNKGNYEIYRLDRL